MPGHRSNFTPFVNTIRGCERMASSPIPRHSERAVTAHALHVLDGGWDEDRRMFADVGESASPFLRKRRHNTVSYSR